MVIQLSNLLELYLKVKVMGLNMEISGCLNEGVILSRYLHEHGLSKVSKVELGSFEIFYH